MENKKTMPMTRKRKWKGAMTKTKIMMNTVTRERLGQVENTGTGIVC